MIFRTGFIYKHNERTIITLCNQQIGFVLTLYHEDKKYIQRYGIYRDTALINQLPFTITAHIHGNVCIDRCTSIYYDILDSDTVFQDLIEDYLDLAGRAPQT